MWQRLLRNQLSVSRVTDTSLPEYSKRYVGGFFPVFGWEEIRHFIITVCVERYTIIFIRVWPGGRL